ncbi:peroxidase isoform X1 [Bactrocera dorsalis]|uniref:Peroxidase isoform X1 n=1 Tax=Bactrocera dorsalis TaxID=27457 RepID=A0A6I9UTV1_BACDO|nr:peroxidase isoform X1 [Bactrocera dorsalis]
MGCRQSNCILLSLLLFLAFKRVANFESKCPFEIYQQYGADPGVYVSSSAAAAFAEVGVRNPVVNKNYDISHVARTIVPKLDDVIFSSKVSDKFRCILPPLDCASDSKNFLYRTFDGSCNNFEYSGYGMATSRYKRMLAPKYGDGVYSPTASVTGAPLPNARLLSLGLYGETSLPDDFRTMAFLQWGQLVAHDMTSFLKANITGDCCLQPENNSCYPIFLYPHGPITQSTSKKCWHFERSASDADTMCHETGSPYSEKITTTSAYLDLSFLYGNSKSENKKFRVFKSGLMKTSLVNNRNWLPLSMNPETDCGKDIYQCFILPDMRNQFIPTIAVLHTIILREHNRIAKILERFNPQYSDERLFNEARKINIAQYQKITFYDWLPLLIGTSYAYNMHLIHHTTNYEYVDDYAPTVNAAPYAEFAAAAFRYSHNQIPGWFSLVSSRRNFNRTLRLSNHFDRPENLNLIWDSDNFDSLIRGLSTQLQKRPDSNIDKEIKHYFDRKSFEEYGTDLKAIDIQRGRDYGLPSYNDMRVYCGLSRAYDWAGFSNEISPDKIMFIEKMYASPDDVDLAIGGSLESHAPESILGPTFQCIIGRQFVNARTGDRFFFERYQPLSGFSKDQLAEIRKASLAQLFCNNADFLQDIQTNAFIFPNIRNNLRNCKSLPQVDLSKWKSPAQQKSNSN